MSKIEFKSLTSVKQLFSLLLLVGSTYACASKKDVAFPEISVNKTEISDSLAKEPMQKTEVNQTESVLLDHSLWDELTKAHVNENGYPNYKGFIQDSSKFNTYLNQLTSNHPKESWSSNERKAFWINAYNAFTVKLIVDNYPVETIKDLGGGIYRVNTPWDIKFIQIKDKTYHLNDLEHNILRKEWSDPRIHAAVNCASISCPKLMKGAYLAEQLDEQLDRQMKAFIHDATKNIIGEKEVRLSKLFKWFSGDFKVEHSSVIDYINSYSDVKIKKSARVEYFDYDWGLNEQR
jgi:hypothetical protein